MKTTAHRPVTVNCLPSHLLGYVVAIHGLNSPNFGIADLLHEHRTSEIIVIVWRRNKCLVFLAVPIPHHDAHGGIRKSEVRFHIIRLLELFRQSSVENTEFRFTVQQPQTAATSSSTTHGLLSLFGLCDFIVARNVRITTLGNSTGPLPLLFN